MWPCFRKIRSPETDEPGRSLSDRVVNGILELHLHMQLDSDYSPCTLAVLSQEPTTPELHGISMKSRADLDQY
jgi:hypothetical protein